jgi:HAD superfamily hydrolase (TIGR01493 family)
MYRLIAEKEHVLLGFDGVICSVFDRPVARDVADRLRFLTGPRLPDDVATSGDPFDVLRYALDQCPMMATMVELELRRCELAAVRETKPWPDVAAALRGLRQAGHTVTIVSNTSMDAVGAHIGRHSLARYVDEVIGRNSGELTPLKPDPFLVRQALMALSARVDACVMVVAKVRDAQAARAVGLDVVDLAAVSLKRTFQ